MARCPACDTENAPGTKFCRECGARMPSSAPRAEVRKTVTVLFADIAGSTSLGERLDPETVRNYMARYFGIARAAIERHGGVAEKFIGDAAMAVFGIPVAHEDDALRAVRSAVDIRSALAGLNAELTTERGVQLSVRTGINTGEVVVGDPSGGETLVTGDPVNTAARLQQAAAPGDILLGRPTYRLVRDAVEVQGVEPVQAKGKVEPVAAYRLLALVGDEGHRRRLDAPLVGREAELSDLQAAYERTVSERGCRIVTVLGMAGVGKSRVVAEFVAALPPEAHVLKGRCLPFRIARERAHERAPGLASFVAARLAHVLIRGGAYAAAEPFLAEADTAAGFGVGWTAVLAGGARARLLAAAGRHAEALKVAGDVRAAAEAAGFDAYPVLYGGCLEDQGSVLAAAEQYEEARAVLASALDAYRDKGAVALASSVELRLRALPG